MKIDPEVIEEVRDHLRKKIREGHLKEQDLEELIMIAATRCQVKMDVKVKQGQKKRDIGSAASRASDSYVGLGFDKSIYEEVEKLCAEIEECLPGLLDNGDLKAHLGLRDGGNADPAFQRVTEYKRSTALQHWMRELKRKLNIPDDGEQNTKDPKTGLNMIYSFRTPARSAVSRSGTIGPSSGKSIGSGNGSLGKKIDMAQDVGIASARGKLGLRGSMSTTESRAGQAAPGGKGRKKKTVEGTDTLEENCEKFKSETKIKVKSKDAKKQTEKKEKMEQSTKDAPSKRRESRMSNISASTKTSNKDKKKKKKRGEEDDSDEELYAFPEYRALTPSEELSIHNDVVNLYKQRGIIENVRKAIGGEISRKMAPRLRTMEQSYWSKRCDVMKRCQATGYYYFLSTHKRHRCQACMAATDERVNEQCNPSPVRIASAEVNLYRPASFTALEGRLRAAKFDDCDCPGAIPIPGQPYKRCIACAYANEQAPMLFDAAVTSDGSHHLTFPTLDTVTMA